MRRVATSRRQHLDLLRRRPTLDPVAVEQQPGQRLDQLRALLRLVDRGVLSPEEFDRQQEKVYRR